MKKPKGIFFDVDGVLKYHDKAMPHAVETINELKKKEILIRLITNSTLKSRVSCAEDLRKYGFDISPAEIITASYATSVYLEEIKPSSCWIMVEGRGIEEFTNIKHNQNYKDPEYIVVGDNRSKFDFEFLNKVLRLLRNGAKLIGMIPDLIDCSMGQWELNVGSWAQMLEKASGVKATYIGKPCRYIFKIALGSTNLKKEDVIMVGDRVSIDIKGAQDFGIKSVLVKTGEFTRDDLTQGIKPDYVFDSLKEISGLL